MSRTLVEVLLNWHLYPNLAWLVDQRICVIIQTVSSLWSSSFSFCVNRSNLKKMNGKHSSQYYHWQLMWQNSAFLPMRISLYLFRRVSVGPPARWFLHPPSFKRSVKGYRMCRTNNTVSCRCSFSVLLLGAICEIEGFEYGFLLFVTLGSLCF